MVATPKSAPTTLAAGFPLSRLKAGRVRPLAVACGGEGGMVYHLVERTTVKYRLA